MSRAAAFITGAWQVVDASGTPLCLHCHTPYQSSLIDTPWAALMCVVLSSSSSSSVCGHMLTDKTRTSAGVDDDLNIIIWVVLRLTSAETQSVRVNSTQWAFHITSAVSLVQRPVQPALERRPNFKWLCEHLSDFLLSGVSICPVSICPRISSSSSSPFIPISSPGRWTRAQLLQCWENRFEYIVHGVQWRHRVCGHDIRSPFYTDLYSPKKTVAHRDTSAKA